MSHTLHPAQFMIYLLQVQRWLVFGIILYLIGTILFCFKEPASLLLTVKHPDSVCMSFTNQNKENEKPLPRRVGNKVLQNTVVGCIVSFNNNDTDMSLNSKGSI